MIEGVGTSTRALAEDLLELRESGWEITRWRRFVDCRSVSWQMVRRAGSAGGLGAADRPGFLRG